MALLEVKSVSKLFNADGKQMEALHDINLDIGENEFVCFIGPMGCGNYSCWRKLPLPIDPEEELDALSSPELLMELCIE